MTSDQCADPVAPIPRARVNNGRGAARPATGAVTRPRRRPTARPGTVPRSRLVQDLAVTPEDVPLVLLTAPAGYGKTTVLTQWAGVDPRPFAWVHLDESDDDPSRLLRHLALALQRVVPLDLSVWRALRSAQAPPLSVVLPRLITAATIPGTPWVLVLDDIHVLRTGLAAEVVTSLASSVPAGFHVVACGRSRSELRLSGLRSRGRCMEFSARDLAFSADEVAAVLNTAGARPSQRAVADLLRRTEGWPAGVYLAALSLRRHAEPRVPAEVTAEDSSFVFDFLRQEVLLREPADTVAFLIRTAPLNEMCGPLCDAVLQTTGSAARLADMADRNLFVVPQEPDHAWYCYHPLFRELLLTELRRGRPEDEARTHRRAAAWFRAQGQPEQAINHALAGRDTAQVADLIATHAQPLMNEGRIYTIRGWLSRVADGALPAHPAFAVVAGWIWALTGDAARAHECLRAAGQALPATPDAPHRGGRHRAREEPDPSLVGAVLRLRAALAPDGVQQMLTDARQALALEPPGGPWYTMAALLYGSALLLNGEPGPAAESLERAAFLAREKQRSGASFSLAQLSMLFADRNDWPSAAAYAAEAVALVEAGHLEDHVISASVWLAQARLAWHRRDAESTRQWIGKALRLYVDPSPVAFPWLAAQTAIRLGRVLLGLEDHVAARRMAGEARRHLAKLQVQGTLADEYAALADALARHADPGPSASSAMTLTTAELRVLRLLPTHLTLSEIADSLYLSRNTVKTQVASIYGKLLASSRTEAVRAARDLNLVD